MHMLSLGSISLLRPNVSHLLLQNDYVLDTRPVCAHNISHPATNLNLARPLSVINIDACPTKGNAPRTDLAINE